MRQFNFTVSTPRMPQPWKLTAAMQLHRDPDQVMPRHGDRLLFFYGHNGSSKKLGSGTCKSAALSTVYRSSVDGKLRITVDGLPLLDREAEWLARDAGYDSAAAFLGYFEKTYGLPFYGVLLRW